MGLVTGEQLFRSASSEVEFRWPCTNRHVQGVSSLTTSSHVRVSGRLPCLVLANREQVKGKEARYGCTSYASKGLVLSFAGSRKCSSERSRDGAFVTPFPVLSE